jgi:hypothetical protein
VLVGQVDLARADPERRVAEPPVGLLDHELLDRTEGGFVERDRGAPAADGEIRRHGADVRVGLRHGRHRRAVRP